MPNFSALSCAILGAFCAILQPHLQTGGGGMIGARIATWSASKPTAKDYPNMPNGAFWDAIENDG